MERETELRIRVTGDLLDDEVADATRGLRSELCDVVDVSVPCRTAFEPGAKSGLSGEIGLLLVSVGPAAIVAVLDVALGWLRRQPLDFALVIDGQRISGPVSRAQRDALVRAYLRRIEAGDAP